MKTKKIAAVLAVTLAGSYIIPTNAIATKTVNKTVLVQNQQKSNNENQDNDGKEQTSTAQNNNTKKDASTMQNNEKPETLLTTTQTTNKLSGTSINFYNIWGGNSVDVSFNTQTMKIQAQRISGDLGDGNNTYLNLVYFNSKTGQTETTEVKDGSSTDLSNVLNNKSFNYGDIIGINYLEGGNLPAISTGGTIPQNNKINYYEITKNGLVPYTPKLKINPFDVLAGQTVTKGAITGTAAPNSQVAAQLDGKTFTATANAQGEFSINVSSNTPFTPTTEIKVWQSNELAQTINPVAPTSWTINNTKIQFYNIWGGNSVAVSFNTETMKIQAQRMSGDLGDGNNNYLNLVYFNSKTGQTETTEVKDGSSTDLSSVLNNKSFNFGDIIGINYQEGGNLPTISTGGTIPQNNKLNYYEITKTGLVPYTPKLNVNPFDVLAGQNVKQGAITGTAAPNSQVEAQLDGKTFTATANAKGEFSIDISSNTPFTPTTEIKVWQSNQLAQFINPIAPTNWTINSTKIQLPNNSLGIAETMSFNPTTMQIENSGSGLASQLIDGQNGNLLASNSDGNFNAFNSKNNIGNASFKFGDIINLYESQETYLSDGDMNLYQNGNETQVSSVNKFTSFKITQAGLVPVANKNLTNTFAGYNGNNDVLISGKTLPNTNVQLNYGNNVTKTIKSNANGDFSLDVPLSQVNIGSVVRIFVNGDNNQALVVGYNPNKFNTNNGIQIVNNESFPVMNFTFSPITNTINAFVYPRDKTYAGVFFGNKMSMSLLDGKTGSVIKTATSANPGEIQSFANQLNGQKYSAGDILKIQYDSNLVSVDVSNDNKQIGNTTGQTEYFEVTNKGIVNVTNKFINVTPLQILGNGNVTTATINGSVSPNENVSADVNGKIFTTKSTSKGDFSLKVDDNSGFTSSTNIVLSADGYMQTTIAPTQSKDIALDNSYINFYQNNASWEATSLTSSIGFNTNNNTFVVNNYSNSFGAGNSNYFTLNLYNANGEKLFGQSFNGSSTSELSSFLNGKKFNYGDVIELNYNSSVYKPVAVNGNNVIGNVNGEKEYFEITKDGLKQVNFGAQALANQIVWNNGNLEVKASLSTGNSESFINQNKKIVLINSDNKVIASENATSSNGIITGELSSKDLNNIEQGSKYTIALEIGNTIVPIYTNINTPTNSEYNLYGSNINELTISKNVKYIDIKNATDIGTYLNSIEKAANNININDLTNNASNSNKILASEFINRIGVSSLESFYNKSTENANFLNWVLNNSVAMSEFLSGPNPDGANVPEDQGRATYAQCLQVWSNIWNTYTNSHDGFNLKLAIAVSLTNGGFIRAYPSTVSVGSPVERYNIFENLNAEGGMMKGFDKLDVSHLCFITNTVVGNDQIQEMRNIILQNHNGLLTPQLIHDLAFTMNYNTKNPHTGASVFGNNFYGPNPTVKDVWYDGGVCGTVGWLGATAAQVFGVPAVMTPQPGHNAFIYYDSLNNTWQIGNAITGWSNTKDADMSSWSDVLSPDNNAVASYTELYQYADNGTLENSNMYLYLATNQTNYENKLNDINQAIKIDNLNMGAWIALVNLYNANGGITLSQSNDLATKAETVFANYSIPMTNLVHYIYANVLQDDITQATTKNDVSKEVVQNAQGILQNVNATNTQILAAIKSLNYKEVSKPATTNKPTKPAVVNKPAKPVVVNNSQLENQLKLDIASANRLMTNNAYTLSSKNVLENAIKAGNSVLANKNSSTEQLKNAINALMTAYNGLTVNTKELASDIDAANNLIQSGKYTKESEAPLLKAIQAANTTLHSNVQAKYIEALEVESAIQNLNSATKMLVVQKTDNKKEVNNPVKKDTNSPLIQEQKDILTNDLSSANRILETSMFNGTSEYTTSSLNNFKTDIANATKVLNNKDVTSKELQVATNNLISGFNELKINLMPLENEVKLADAKINQNVYTAQSLDSLKTAVANANTTLKQTNPQMIAVKYAQQEVLNAVNSLKIDYTTLNNDIMKANQKINEGGYTKASIDNLENVVNSAKALVNGKTTTGVEVLNAQMQLQNAVNGLQKIQTPEAKTTIKTSQNTDGNKKVITNIPAVKIANSPSNTNNNDNSFLNNLENGLKNFFGGLSSLF
ncbi:MAG: hypothetical protein ACRCX8_11915 [Sarcina sp.]